MFRKFGVMVDCSRNAVMTVEALKKFMTVLAKMGYNQVQLYMEDTYEVENQPHFGYLRGRYSCEELKELDDFADSLGVELVPNIQTLAHMNAYVRWDKKMFDVDDILLVGDEKVYTLIEDMFRTLRGCFRTNKIHIGMDEAHLLGRGKYYDLHGPENRFDILLKHLQKVCEIAEKYGFQPMMWSDMFYRLASGGEYYAELSKFDPAIREKIPENVTLVYWDYYSTDKNRYDAMIRGHRQLSDNIAFAGGAWKWKGFAPHNGFSVKATKAAFHACQKHGVQDVFLTMWGDNGAECANFSVLPSLCYAACFAQGITKMADIRAKFTEWTGLRYDDFMLLDLPNHLIPTEKPAAACKNYLYADCFASVFQKTERTEYSAAYAAYARKLKFAMKRAGEFAYLFDTMAKLCDLLALKQDICTRTRSAYAKGDVAPVLGDYKKLIKRTEAFYEAFRTQWFMENKPHGFDVQDIRLGGLLQRLKACLRRLEEYRDGKISSIPELEEEILEYRTDVPAINRWDRACSVNVL